MAQIYKHSTSKLFSPKYLLTWPLFGLAWLIGQLPHGASIKIGNALGGMLYKLLPKRKYIVKTNLQTCFPDKTDSEIESLVKQHFQSLVTGACETAMAWFGPKKAMTNLAKIVEYENLDILEQYIQSDQPLLLITPHSVSQEFLSKLLATKYDYIPVFRHMNNPVANYLMQKARLRIYKDVILKANTRNIVKILKEKTAPIAILPDQDFGRKRSIFVPFFNTPAATTTSLSKYKKLTGANIVPLSYYRKFDNQNNLEKFIIRIDQPLNITGNNLEHDACEFNKNLEQIISRDISAYFWVARKFKTRPLGESKIYNYKSKSILKKLKAIYGS